MKHKLTLLASLAAVAGSLALSVNVHRADVQRRLVLDTKAAAVHARQVALEQAQAHANAAKVQRLEVGCQNGLLAYNLLSATQKEHVVKPGCSL